MTEHTFEGECRLSPVSPAHAYDHGGITPRVEAQFFYDSSIPIDDPFWASSTTATADKRSGRHTLRPFSRGDNNTLEKAWLNMMSAKDRNEHERIRTGKLKDSVIAEQNLNRRTELVRRFTYRHIQRHRTAELMVDSNFTEDSKTGSCCKELLVELNYNVRKDFCSLARRADPSLSVDTLAREITAAVLAAHRNDSDANQIGSKPKYINIIGQPNLSSREEPCSFVSHQQQKPAGESDNDDTPSWSNKNTDLLESSPPQVANYATRGDATGNARESRYVSGDPGITGRLFERVQPTDSLHSSAPSSLTVDDTPATDVGVPTKDTAESTPQRQLDEASEVIESVTEAAYTDDLPSVTVGVSKLHMVVLSTLQMKPIYWSPLNDVAVVTRATWFYRDTMLPVSAAVANQLEAGYRDLRPWTDTWADEIRCALDVGSVGEEKISHQLWPQDLNPAHRASGLPHYPMISSDLYCASHCFYGEAAAHGSVELPSDERVEKGNRPFSNYHVIYKNSAQAFLLKPNLKPSAYYGRCPVRKIMAGSTVGVPVIRGFDRHAWDYIRSPKPTTAGQGESRYSSRATNEPRSQRCQGCEAEKDRGQITDLILVAHGIGQKIAERVESFHFTHAINSFRRTINMDLRNPTVQKVLRDDYTGLMILPLNWRMGLSFEDGGPFRDGGDVDHTSETFGLKDIEPETIPAVRSMISDVMFDIPFYMSHHKTKMITALVLEANRVYRLWCKNNPGFDKKGRVHMIAHSLGSVMALDILSHQPTEVPKLNLSAGPATQHFEFDTKNLFLVGSPAGFFLLLEKGALLPRRGRCKPGADSGDILSNKVVGDAGTFGCLAVDNLYNVLAKEDPIAYLLTGAIDSAYSSGLKTAYVPSTVPSLMKLFGNAVRQIVPGIAPAPDPSTIETERPSAVRLPSQLELEVHDFTREEIAEKKAYLLNDNGQIDWFLRSGGGPLEIQYLNMLSAHTSYWTNNDFIRMICLETGRKPGRTNTLPAMRAVKAASSGP